MDEREQKYLNMIAEFPESPLGHFTLGKYYVEVGRFEEAIAPLQRCLAEEPEWAAAMVALADALVACKRKDEAIALLKKARATPQASHGIGDDIDERLSDLEG